MRIQAASNRKNQNSFGSFDQRLASSLQKAMQREEFYKLAPRYKVTSKVIDFVEKHELEVSIIPGIEKWVLNNGKLVRYYGDSKIRCGRCGIHERRTGPYHLVIKELDTGIKSELDTTKAILKMFRKAYDILLTVDKANPSLEKLEKQASEINKELDILREHPWQRELLCNQEELLKETGRNLKENFFNDPTSSTKKLIIQNEEELKEVRKKEAHYDSLMEQADRLSLEHYNKIKKIITSPFTRFIINLKSRLSSFGN